MQLILAQPWQLSPLTDLSLPQNDLILPAPLSAALPDSVSESDVMKQEWHLMHDIEVEDAIHCRIAAYDLILDGIEYYAEVRINGVAVLDCDRTQRQYRKDITSLINVGKNRIEILFVQEDDDLLDDECKAMILPSRDVRLGIWQAPRIELIKHVRLCSVTTEQVWHHGDVCELLVAVNYEVLKSDLLAATVKFAGLSYQVPLDMRANTAQSIFYIDAPQRYCSDDPDSDYQVHVEVDEQVIVTSVRF
ncbi:glycosyl hydrolase 2 galactose-binding domain-containing protein [Vibrio palustris]|uniref:Beta-mannosidase-like galactose-binding domain-containing protein n=1 Tax=Vibrio palustris TaxID=1918946 RepID=A0A1R4B7M1_9VIBR|nr:hypothetical protein [Vibrio palustris]SJL84912.1 hypothetical protein VPAL9027_02915 [Vibrio palustris]